MPIRDVHVAFDDSRYSSFIMLYKRGEYENLKDFTKVLFCHKLTCGDVSNVPYSNPEVARHQYIPVEDIKKTNEYFLKRFNDLPPDVNIKLWVDFDIPDEFLNFCYFAHLFIGRKNVELIRMNFFTDRKRRKRPSMPELLSTAVPISDDELRGYARQWELAREQNTYIRYVKAGRIFSEGPERFEKIVMSCVSRRFRSYRAIEYKAEKKAMRQKILFEFDTFCEIMLRLIDQNKIVPRSPFGWEETDPMLLETHFKRV